jgi:hypothetical protein
MTAATTRSPFLEFIGDGDDHAAVELVLGLFDDGMPPQRVLIGTAMGRLAGDYPAVRDYDQRQWDATAEDMGHIVDFLAAALYVSEGMIFTDFVVWTRDVLAARGVPPAALRAGLLLVRDQPRDYPAALAVIDAGMARVTP